MQPAHANSGALVADQTRQRPRLHVLTLTSFFPSAGDEVSGCFVAELLDTLRSENVYSSVVAVDTLHHPRKSPDVARPAHWLRYPQIPGNVGLSSAGVFLYERLKGVVRRLHHQQPIDLIHAHAALPCGHAAALLSKHFDIPFVVSVHGLDAFNTCFVEGRSVAWRHRASCKVYREAASVICISEKVRRIVSEQIGSSARADLVYNGTDTEFFHPEPLAERQAATLLVVGNLLRGKGQELVLRAVEKLRTAHCSIRCVFIGEGQDREYFMDVAKRLRVDDCVNFVGRKSRSEVAAAMRSCTLFVLPCRYEALGCVYLEAMASGTPVIACRGQGIDEIIRHRKNGWLIGVEDLEELVEGISTLLGDSELRAEIGREARRSILDGLTLQHQAAQVRALYESVMA